MTNTLEIFAAGFGHRANGDRGKIKFTKAFRRKPQNAAAVDDMVKILQDLEIYSGGSVHILLSEVKDLAELKSKLEDWPHNGFLGFITEAQGSGNSLDEYVVVIMLGEAMSPVQAELLRKADEK